MMKEVIVTDVNYSSEKNCITVEYEDSSGTNLTAATAECLCPRVGDKIWVLKNDKLDYKGFNAVAVLMA